MSILKTLGKVFGGALFALSIVLLVSSYSFTLFIQPSNVEGVVSTVIEARASEAQMMIEGVRQACSNIDSIPVSYGDISMTVDCVKVRESSDQEIISIFSGQVLQSVYEKDYGCDFLVCILNASGPESMTVLFSSTARDFFQSMMLYALAGAIVFGAIMMLSLNSWHARLKNFGRVLLAIGIPMMAFFVLGSTIISLIVPAEFASTVIPIVEKFVAKIIPLYITILVTGAAMTAAAYLIVKEKNQGNKKMP